jgi:hypothetical protein
MDRNYSVLLTGTFYSKNWIIHHLAPLAAANAVEKIDLVSTFPLANIQKVRIVKPWGWCIKAFGEVPSRLATFVLRAIVVRPDFIGGFHLLINGLLANPNLLKRFSEEATVSVKRFSIKKTAALWDVALAESFSERKS